MDPVYPGNPLVIKVQAYLEQHWGDDSRITDIHDIRVVETDNHRVILFGINVRVGMSQSKIVECHKELETDLNEKFSGYDINIKVSPLHRY
jgi:divalent metal cation (Fe/Co/Zn/Cd) transporter